MGHKIWGRACIFLSRPTTPAAVVSTEVKPNFPLRTQLHGAYNHRTHCEELNLLLFGDGRIPAGECHEPLSELIDRAGATQHGQLSQRRVGERRIEPGIH
jgi:hypothetical protein